MALAEDTLATDIKDIIVTHLTDVVLPVIMAQLEGITVPKNESESEPAFTQEQLDEKEAELIEGFENTGDIHNKVAQPIIDIIEAKLEVKLMAFADEVKAYIDDLETAIQAWSVVSNDGGQAFRDSLDLRGTTSIPSPINGVKFNDT